TIVGGNDRESGPKVTKRYVKDLNEIPYPESFIVPGTEAVHDRIQLETFRGCTQGCRYCQAGMVYRPRRERKAAGLVNSAAVLYERMGCEEISLLSLNAPDYSEMETLMDGLMEYTAQRKISISLPSTRMDTFTGELGRKMRAVRGTGLTLAPEAGTQRLRDVINKRITDEEIMRTIDYAVGSGWKKIKLYFMIGLPVPGRGRGEAE
ncbi:MAG TPA: radical SAM protein, partial [bacterium]|nr:radical SAM protein [bacterium]